MQKNAEGALPQELSALIADVTHARHDGFYRKFYRLGSGAEKLMMDTLEEWRSLPILAKKDLIDTPIQERLYCAIRDVDECFDATSGTSGGPPLFVGRTHLPGFEFREHVHDFSRPVLCASQPTPQRVDHMVQVFNPGGASLVLDAHNISASISLAKSVGTRSVIMPAHLARGVAESIRDHGFADRITSIELNGGAIGTDMATMVLTMLPNATMTLTYSSTETEAPPVAMTRTTRDASDIDVFYPQNGFFLELIDPETLQAIDPVSGVEGELVLTRWMPRPFAFPLVRYRTGDIARVLEIEKIADPKNGLVEPSLTAHTGCEPFGKNGFLSSPFCIVGRHELDFIKIPGGVLRVDEIERALRQELGERVFRFEAECIENANASRAHVSLTIHIDTSSGISLSGRAGLIAEHLRVSPSLTYADGVRNGMYDPLICKDLNTPQGASKPRRLRKIANNR